MVDWKVAVIPMKSIMEQLCTVVQSGASVKEAKYTPRNEQKLQSQQLQEISSALTKAKAGKAKKLRLQFIAVCCVLAAHLLVVSLDSRKALTRLLILQIAALLISSYALGDIFVASYNRRSERRRLQKLGAPMPRKVPDILYECCDFIQDSGGLSVRGIFRRTCKKSDITLQLKRHERGNALDFSSYTSSYGSLVAACVLKKYLREWNEAERLIPEPLAQRLIAIVTDNNRTEHQKLDDVKRNLHGAGGLFDSQTSLQCLGLITDLFSKVCQNSEKNQMNSTAIAISSAPSIVGVNFEALLKDRSNAYKNEARLLTFLVDHSSDLSIQAPRHSSNSSMALPVWVVQAFLFILSIHSFSLLLA